MSHAHTDHMPGQMNPSKAASITRRVAMLSVATASVLIALKLAAWILSDSVAMLSSLADSGLDGAASLFTLLAVTYAAMPPDKEHRFGHGKAESFAAIFQAVLVGVSAALIAIEAISHFVEPKEITHSGISLGVMGISILMTLALVWAQSRAIAQTGSVATKGDRAHYMADLGANAAVIGGIVAAGYLGLKLADPLIGLAVAIWLVHSALDVAREGIDQLLDREISDEARARIVELALQGTGILDVHQLRTRASGPWVHIQFHADMPADLSLIEAHEIMVRAENSILTEFPAADVTIHPDPRGHAETHGAEAFAFEEKDHPHTHK